MSNLKISVPMYLIDEFQAKLTKAKKKMATVGFELKIIDKEYYEGKSETLTKRIHVNHPPWSYEAPITIQFVRMEFNVPLTTRVVNEDTEDEFTVTEQADKYVREGYDFVGTVTNKDGVPQTFEAIETEYNLQQLVKWSMKCAHCDTKRNRVKYFFFRKTGETELMAIGSTCVKEYFGLDAEKMLKTFERTMNILGGGLGKNVTVYSISEIIENAVWNAYTNKYWDRYEATRWVDYAREIRMCTDRKAREAMEKDFAKYHEELEALTDKVTYWKLALRKEAVEIFCKYNDQVRVDSFDLNFMNMLLHEDGSDREVVTFLGLSIANRVYRPVSDERRKTQRDLEQGESEWVGQVKERINFGLVKLIYETSGEGAYGEWFLYKFVTSEGNVLTWFSSNEFKISVGDEIDFTATIKKHDSYEGKKSTVVTRGKVTIH